MTIDGAMPTLEDAAAFAHAGRTQPAIPWPAQAWIDAFPAYEELFRTFPERLDREVIRACCSELRHDPDGAVRAFLVSMAWGYGRTGYGPFRTSQVLKSRGAASKLAHARSEVLSGGPLAGYRALAGPDRLEGLGPAFGTKYLYFQNPDALILDSLIAEWYQAVSGIDPRVTVWNSAMYAGYVAHMQLWAEKVIVEPDQLEAAVFTIISTTRGGQWREA